MTAQVGAAWVPTVEGGASAPAAQAGPGGARSLPWERPLNDGTRGGLCHRPPSATVPPPPVTVTSATVSLSPEPPPAPRSRPSAAEWRRTPLDAGFPSRRATSRSSRKERAPGRGGRDHPPRGTAPAAPCARGRHTKEARGELCEGPSAARSLGSAPEPACHRHAEQCHRTGSRRQRREEPEPAVPAAGTGPGPPWGRGAAWGSAGADAPCRRASGPAAATVTGHRAARGRGSRVEPAGEPGFRTPTQLRSLRRPRDPGCPGTRAVRLSRKGGQGGLLQRGGREGSVVSPDSRELAGCRTLLGTQPRYPKG